MFDADLTAGHVAGFFKVEIYNSYLEQIDNYVLKRKVQIKKFFNLRVERN